VAGIQKGLLPKDMIEKLKHIEKLSSSYEARSANKRPQPPHSPRKRSPKKRATSPELVARNAVCNKYLKG